MKKKSKASPQARVPAGMTAQLMHEETVAANGSLPKTTRKNAKKNGKRVADSGAEELSFSDYIDDHELLKILTEIKHGNFNVRMPVDRVGLSGKICDTLNEIISLNEILVEELAQSRNTIGKQGHLNHRVAMPKYAKGSWRKASESINSLISDLVHPTIEIAHVISSVAKGNLSQAMPLKIGTMCCRENLQRLLQK
jgi:hypothetical protein